MVSRCHGIEHLSLQAVTAFLRLELPRCLPEAFVDLGEDLRFAQDVAFVAQCLVNGLADSPDAVGDELVAP